MAFTQLGIGHYRYDDGTGDAEYYEVECGGGGNCLYLCLAWLLGRNAIVTDHGTLRQAARNRLVAWVTNLPGHVNNYNVPLPTTLVAANKVGNAGEYGDLASVVALVEDYFANNVDIEVHLLGPEEDDVVVYRSPLTIAEDPDHRIHLYYLSYIHYRALIVSTDVDDVPAGQVVANCEADQVIGQEQKPKKLSASLLLGGSDSGKNNTYNAAAGARLEIHTIDVGQGEATLILIWNGADCIVKSILIDAGIAADRVTAYFDQLIQNNRFRPVDLFFASHYDVDHIGGARGVLDDPKYTNTSVLIFDSGVPKNKLDEDYVKYIQTKRGANRRLPPLDQPVLENCEGVTLHCLYRNGLMAHRSALDHGKESPQGPYSLEMDDNLELDEILDSGEMEKSYYPTNKNDCSLGLLLEFGNFRYFTAGDLSGKFEAEVAEVIHAKCGFVTMMKAGHHGAGEATTGIALTLLKPRLVTISCGFNNSHGHPAESCIRRLEDLGSKVTLDYLVTGDIADESTASGQGFPAFPAGDRGLADVGTIIVTVTDVGANAATQAFNVFSTKQAAGYRSTCDDRSGTTIVKVDEWVKKRQRQGVSDEDRKRRHTERQLEKKARVDEASKFLRQVVRDRAGQGADAILGSKDFTDSLESWAEALVKNNRDDEYWPTSSVTAAFKNEWKL
jgi:competence protein ComEC